MLRSLLVEVEADRTTHACTTQPAIATGIFCEVLLMVVLGVVESIQRSDLRRTFTAAGRGQAALLRCH